MTFRTILLLAAALVLTLLTALLMRGWVDQQRAHLAAVQPSTNATRVLVAKTDLPVGRFIRAEDLAWQDWPAKGVAKSYAVEGKRPEKEFLGAVVRHPLGAGQPVTDEAVVKPGDRGFLAAVLKPGDRAVSVKVTATSGIAGLVFPGDRVDIILTQTLERRNRDAMTQRHASLTVLHDIRVLAIDQNLSGQAASGKDAKSGRAGTEGSHTATLEVTPKQGEIVAVAAEMGNLSLELRSLATPHQDNVADATGGVTGPSAAPAQTTYTLDSQVSRLLPPLEARAAPPTPAPANAAAHDPAPAARPESQTVVILRGSKDTTVSTPSSAAPGMSQAPVAGGPPPYVPAPSPYARQAANRMVD